MLGFFCFDMFWEICCEEGGGWRFVSCGCGMECGVCVFCLVVDGFVLVWCCDECCFI